MQATSLRRAFAGLGGMLRSQGDGARRGLLFASEAIAATLSPAFYTPAVRAVAARQLCASSWQVLPGLVLFCALLSYVVIRIVVATARDYGLSAYALDVFVRLLVLELIPLFVALFVALRSGAGIGTEVALLLARGEPDGRRAQEAEAEAIRAQFLPRGLGNAVAVLVLTATGCLVALAVAYVGLYGLSPWGHAAYSRAVGQVFGPLILAGFALKIALFAFAVAVIPVAASLGMPRGMPSVSAAAPRGLVRVFVGLALVEAVSLVVKYV